jgi:hypothetical protein
MPVLFKLTLPRPFLSNKKSLAGGAMPALSANAHHLRQLRLPSRTLEEDRTTCSATYGVRRRQRNDGGGMALVCI